MATKPIFFYSMFADKSTFWCLICSFLFFVFLWVLDFPKPFIDDLFYAGAGMNMAGGGDLSNPFIVRYFPGQHWFFAYPPVQSYALAGWFKLFGVNAAAATAFQVTMYFCMTVAIVAILKRHGAPTWLAWLVPLVAIDGFMERGLRPEALATALTWGGFAVIECGARRFLTVFIGFFLMFLAGATAPRLVIFDVALILLAAWHLWQNARSNKAPIWHPVVAIAAALAGALLSFLMMIHFRFSEFWAELRLHSSVLNVGEHFRLWQQALLVLGAFMAIFAWRYRHDRLVQICIAVGIAFCIALLTHTLNFGPGGWHALLVILFLAAVILKKMSRAIRVTLQSAVCLVFFCRNIPFILQIFGILSGRIESGCGNKIEAARALKPTADQQLLVDTVAARYVFDYRLPRGSLDFAFSVPFPMVGNVMPDLIRISKPQDTLLLSPRFLAYVERSTYMTPRPRERWTFLRWSFDRYPRKIYIVSAADFKGLRSAIERP
jgi:hypothetical protein